MGLITNDLQLTQAWEGTSLDPYAQKFDPIQPDLESLASMKKAILGQNKLGKQSRMDPNTNPAGQESLAKYSLGSITPQQELMANQQKMAKIQEYQKAGFDDATIHKALVAEGFETPQTQDEVGLASNAFESRLGLYSNPDTSKILDIKSMQENDLRTGNKDEGYFPEAVDSLQYGLGSFATGVADAVVDTSTRGVKEGIKYFGNMSEEEANKSMRENLNLRKDWFSKDMDYIALDAYRKPEAYGYNDKRTKLAMLDVREAKGTWDTAKAVLSNLSAGPEMLGASSGEMLAGIVGGPAGLIAMSAKYSNDMLAEREKITGKPAGNDERAATAVLGSMIAVTNKLTDSYLVGKNIPVVKDILDKVIKSGNPYAVKSLMTNLSKRGLDLVGKTSAEGFEEVFQDGLQAIGEKYGTKEQDYIFSGKHVQDAIQSFAGGVIGSSPISGTSAARGAIGDVIRDGNIQKELRQPSEAVARGYNTEADRVKHSNTLDEAIKNNNLEVSKVESIENAIQKTVGNTSIDTIDKLSNIQEMLPSNLRADTHSADVVKAYGSTEISNTVKQISSILKDSEFDQDILNKLASDVSSAKSVNQKLGIINDFATSNYGNFQPQELQGIVKAENSLTKELTANGKKILEDHASNISFNKVKAVADFESKKMGVTKSNIDKRQAPKDTSVGYETISKMSEKQIDNELSSYSGPALNALKAEAIKAAKIARGVGNIEQQQSGINIVRRINLAIRGNKDERVADNVAKSIDSILKTRKNTKQVYDPKMSIKDKFEGFVKNFKTRLDKHMGTDKNTAKEYAKQSSEAIVSVANKLNTEHNTLNKEDIPIVEEVANQLKKLGELSEVQYNKILNQVKAYKATITMPKKEDIRPRVEEIAKEITKASEDLLDTTTKVTRKDVKNKISELFNKLIKQNLNARELAFLAKTMGKIDDKLGENSEISTYLAEKKQAILNHPLVTKENKGEAIKQTLLDAYAGVKQAVSAEGRENIAVNLTDKVDRMSKTVMAKDSKELLNSFLDKVSLSIRKSKVTIHKLKKKASKVEIPNSIEEIDEVYVKGINAFKQLLQDDVEVKEDTVESAMQTTEGVDIKMTKNKGC